MFSIVDFNIVKWNGSKMISEFKVAKNAEYLVSKMIQKKVEIKFTVGLFLKAVSKSDLLIY